MKKAYEEAQIEFIKLTMMDVIITSDEDEGPINPGGDEDLEDEGYSLPEAGELVEIETAEPAESAESAEPAESPEPDTQADIPDDVMSEEPLA